MKIKRDWSSIIIRSISWVIIITLALSILLPMINIIALAFNSGADAQKGGITFWPRQFSLDNFKEIFKQGTILNALFISLAKTIIGTVLSVILTAMAAYALTIKSLPFRRTISFFLSLYDVIQCRCSAIIYLIESTKPDRYILGLYYSIAIQRV